MLRRVRTDSDHRAFVERVGGRSVSLDRTRERRGTNATPSVEVEVPARCFSEKVTLRVNMYSHGTC